MTFLENLPTRRIVHASCWTAACVFLSITCAVQAQTDAAGYLSLCRQHGVNSGKEMVPGDNDSAYELRGVVSGLAETGESFSLILRMPDGVTMTLNGAGKAPGVSVNLAVRVLVSGKASSGTADTPVLAVIAESEAALEQQARMGKKAVAAKTRTARKGTSAKRRVARRAVVPLTSRNLTGSRAAGYGVAEETLNAYKKAIRYFNKRGSEAEIETIARSVLYYSLKYQVDARLVMAVFAVESGFKPGVTSRAGAMGIGQLMPGTAAGLGVSNAYDPAQNIEGAIKYLRNQLDRHEGKDEWTRLQLVLASYNAGPGAVKKYRGIPPYRETQSYVRKVSQWFFRFIGS